MTPKETAHMLYVSHTYDPSPRLVAACPGLKEAISQAQEAPS